MDQAIRELRALKDRMASPRTRLRERNKLDEAIERILQVCGASPWLEVEVGRKEDVRFRQVTAGRPGPHTRYRRVVRLGFDLAWRSRSNALLYDERTDGIFPLVTSDRKLSPKQILQAYKLGQPGVEQRHHHLKAVHEVALQYLKSVARIEAFLCVYFFALLVNALIEREIRQAMKRRRLRALPIYPESRPCKRPTTEQILKIFEGLMVHRLSSAGGPQHIYQPNLTRLQRQVLRLLGIQPQAYRIGME